MYTTVVKVKRIGDKSFLKHLIPVGVWIVAFVISFAIFAKVSHMTFPLLIVVFFSIIPITSNMAKNIAKANKENYDIKEVTFHVSDGKLYTDGIKLTPGKYSDEDKMYVESYTLTNTSYAGNVIITNFFGVIEGEYMDDFITFLLRNGVKIRNLAKTDDDYEEYYTE